MPIAETDALRMAYVEAGPADGWPVILSHGFPYDVHAYDEVTPILAAAGARVLAPYLRGFGPTRMRHDGQMRSGQQAALGKDLVDLMNALGVDRAILAGYDWGGLSSCVAAVLWPERVAGLVSLAGYDVIDIERMRHPFPPSLEAVMWYQHLFQTERGREALTTDRRTLCELLWRQWSPRWNFDAATFERTAPSFDNPDFVDIVIHAYRFDFGLAAGDPELEPLERRLQARPKIRVTNTCAISKFNRVGVSAGIPAKRRYVRIGEFFDRTEGATRGIPFWLDVESDAYRGLWPQAYEPWTADMEVFHNPFARNPLPKDLVPEATHWFDQDGELVCTSHYETSILSSQTVILDRDAPIPTLTWPLTDGVDLAPNADGREPALG